MVEGRFESAFAGQPSPLLPEEDAEDEPGDGADAAPVDVASDPATDTPADLTDGEAQTPVISTVVEHSPPSARLIVIGSDSFLSDTAMTLATEATQSRYLKPLELVQNAVEWSLEDRGLLALRGRGQFNRLLEPVGRQQRMFWEYLNYALAAAGLALVYWVHRLVRRRRERALEAMLVEDNDARALA
jgi:ABC-2 type transport system permease protein